MKQRKNLKKLLSLTVSAVMLLSCLSIGAMAEDAGVITSDYYEIVTDGEVHAVKKVLYNTFVGDFMKRIDAGSNTKQLFAADGETEVLNGFVKDDMILRIGNVDYSIEYYTLYDLGAKMDAYVNAQGEDFTSEALLEYNYDNSDEKKFANVVATSKLSSTRIFVAGLLGGGNEASGDKMTATIYKNNGAPYLELYTNRAQPFHLVTEVLDNYAEEDKYVGKYVVSEVDIDSFTYDAETQAFNSTAAVDEKKTGLFYMNHYYNVKFTDEESYDNLTATADNILSDIRKSSMVFFGNRGRLAMGRGYKDTAVSSKMSYLSDSDKYAEGKAYSVKQYNTISASTGKDIKVKGLFLSQEVTKEGVTEVQEESLLTAEATIGVKDTVEKITRISRGMIGVAANHDKNAAGKETKVKINNYKLYLAENLHTAKDEVSDKSDVVINGASGNVYITDEETGYASVYKDADRNNRGYLKYIVPGTTVKELRDSVNFDNDSVYVWVVKSVDEVPELLADSDIITEGCKMYVSAPTLQSNGAKVEKPVSLELANYGNATYTVDNGIYTVTRQSDNNIGVKFIAAAYDNSGKLISAKLAADKENSVTFGAFEAEPATIKVFVFRNLSNLLPVADAVPAAEASTQE